MAALRTQNLNDNLLLQQNSHHIMGAFSKFGIRVDPQILALNQNKENAISQIITQLESALARDKNFQNSRVFTFMRCMLLNALAQEANANYFKANEMKQLLHDLRALILKMASNDFDRQLRIAEDERTKMIACERQLQTMYQDVFNQTFQGTVNAIAESKNTISGYNQTLKDLKTQSKENKKELALYTKDKARELIEKHDLKDVKPDLLSALIEKCMKEKVKTVSKASKYQNKINHSLALDDISRTERDNIIASKEALINKARYENRGQFFPAENKRYNQPPFRMTTEIKLKMEEFDTRLAEINDEMEKRKSNREGKIKDIAALVSDPEAILKAQLDAFSTHPAAAGATSDELRNLKEAFNKPAFKNDVKQLLSEKDPHIEKLLEAKAVKHDLKLKQRHEVNTAIKLCEKQITPVGKMNTISACPADISAKAQQINELKADVQKARYDYLTPEQMQRKEAKREQKASAAAAAALPPRPSL